MNAQQLTAQLTTLTYADLFLYLDDTPLEQIWDSGTSQAGLEQLVLDEGLETTTRFLAAEILFSKNPHYPPEAHRTALAAIYAQILADNTTPNANIWGMPGEVDGSVGQHLLRIGQAVVAQLAPLLTNETSVFYEGSEEATVGNSYHYRVKDFAAFFISRLAAIPYTLHQTPAARDTAIAALAEHWHSNPNS